MRTFPGEEALIDRDGCINFEEFVSMMMML